MLIKKILVKNIRSYISQVIEFPEGSVLLAGDVGTGKTSLLLSIEYALFGLQPGQNSASLLRTSASSGEVSLLCEIDGKEIILERKLKRGTKNITNEYAAITIDGEKNECSVTELKKKVLTLLGYPSELVKKNNLLYRYTVYTPQEHMKHIILEDSESRLNILRHIFGINKYKTIQENIQKVLLSLKEDAKFLQGEIKTLEQQYSIVSEHQKKVIILEDSCNKKIEELALSTNQKEKAEEEHKQVVDKIKQKDKLESELDKIGIMILSKKEAMHSLEKEYSLIQKAIAEEILFDEKMLIELSDSLNNQKKVLSALNEAYISKKSQINSIIQQEKEALSKKERIFSMDICPTCLQDVPLSHKHNILISVDSSLSKLANEKALLINEEAEIENKISINKLNLSKLEENKMRQEIAKSRAEYLEQEKKKLIGIASSIDSIRKDICLLEKHSLSVKEDLFNFSNILPILKSKEENLKKFIMEERRLEIHLAEIKKEIEMTKKEIEDLFLSINEKERSKQKLTIIQDINDWLSNDFISLIQFIENTVLLQLRAEFSRIFSKWCYILVPDSFEVHLDENFTPIITQREIEMEYGFLSGGERTAVALAYRLALNQMINSVVSQIKTRDLLILDEPTEGFSESQLEKVRDVLAELNVKQLILVSHEPKIENFVEHVLKIRKEAGESIVE